MCGSGFTQMFRPWTAHGSTFTGVSPSSDFSNNKQFIWSQIIPKSVISLIDALFVFLRYIFFLIYIPAKITWTLYWRFVAFISEYFFRNVCDGPTFTCIHRPYYHRNQSPSTNMWKSTAVNTKKTLRRRRNKSGASAISHYFQRLNFLRMKEENTMWNIRLFFNRLELVTMHK